MSSGGLSASSIVVDSLTGRPFKYDAVECIDKPFMDLRIYEHTIRVYGCMDLRIYEHIRISPGGDEMMFPPPQMICSTGPTMPGTGGVLLSDRA